MEKKMSEELHNRYRLSRALGRQIKGILTNAKIARDATDGEDYKEILTWLSHVESCLTEAQHLSCELRTWGKNEQLQSR